MFSQLKFRIITFAIIIIGVILILHQNIAYQVPFNPNMNCDVWTVEAKLEYEPEKNQPTDIVFCLPATQRGYTLLEQRTISFGFGSSYLQKDGSKLIQWTKNTVKGKQTLYYRANLLKDDSDKSSMTVPAVDTILEEEPFQSAMLEIAEKAYAKSAAPYSFAAQVIYQFNHRTDVSELLEQRYDRNDLLVKILNLKNVPAKKIEVLDLEKDAHNLKLKTRVAVFDKTKYLVFDVFTGASGMEENQIIWNDNRHSVLKTKGGHVTSLSFSTLKDSVSGVMAAEKKNGVKKAMGEEVYSFSLDCLPVETQCLLDNMLLIPVGVLVAIFLCVIVGIKTFGTFMPVLIAVTFLEISPFWGVVGFFVVVGLGLVIRKLFSHFDLLLIGRISATLVSVIIIIMFTSYLSFKVGITNGVKVTLFPIVILAWTIERISVLWEEEGGIEVMRYGIGTMIVALCSCYLMGNSLIQYLTFNFIGIQFVLLGIILLIGNYTGFKLTELVRFEPLISQIKIYKNGDEEVHESIRLSKEIKAVKENSEAVTENHDDNSKNN